MISVFFNHAAIQHGDEDQPLNREERAALLDETIDFFLGPGRSTCSLDALCDSLDLDAERVPRSSASDAGRRGWVRVVAPAGDTRRDRGDIGAAGRRRVLDAIRRSVRLYSATVRKVRIRARKRAQIFGTVSAAL